MLTLEQMNENEIRFMELLAKLNIDLTEINKFLDEVNYFKAPFTAQYAGAYAGGLCEHALQLAQELGVLCNAYFPGRYTTEDILKVALFKDIYKATMYETFNRNVKDEVTGQWNSVLAFRTKDSSARQVFGDVGISSYMQIKNLIDLTDEQIEAIIHAKSDYEPDIHEIMRKFPLVALTRMAEMAVSYIR